MGKFKVKYEIYGKECETILNGENKKDIEQNALCWVNYEKVNSIEEITEDEALEFIHKRREKTEKEFFKSIKENKMCSIIGDVKHVKSSFNEQLEILSKNLEENKPSKFTFYQGGRMCGKKSYIDFIKSEQEAFQKIIDFQIRQRGFFQLKDLQKLSDISKIYGITRQTLLKRLIKLEEGIDYLKSDKRQPIWLTPVGVEKIININEVKL